VPLLSNLTHQAHPLALSFVCRVPLQYIVAAEQDVVRSNGSQKLLLCIFRAVVQELLLPEILLLDSFCPVLCLALAAIGLSILGAWLLDEAAWDGEVDMLEEQFR